ncbi:hypothetical protein V1478_006065 [Vespula squamosa]|uniref:Uncharacterized protein n=1 Tax=Vespula squamosa TaxID=30214 RepID=A0ABD2B765_VESSQ
MYRISQLVYCIEIDGTRRRIILQKQDAFYHLNENESSKERLRSLVVKVATNERSNVSEKEKEKENLENSLETKLYSIVIEEKKDLRVVLHWNVKTGNYKWRSYYPAKLCPWKAKIPTVLFIKDLHDDLCTDLLILTLFIIPSRN